MLPYLTPVSLESIVMCSVIGERFAYFHGNSKTQRDDIQEQQVGGVG